MKSKNMPCEWEEPKPQCDKFCEGEGASVKDGLSARVPMHGEYERWHDRGYGPDPYRKEEGIVKGDK